MKLLEGVGGVAVGQKVGTDISISDLLSHSLLHDVAAFKFNAKI